MTLAFTSKQKQIINAADTVLLEVGVNDFTVDKVIEHLGIAKGTVYKYFESKDDLLAEVSTKALNQLLNYFRLSERNTPEGIEQTRNILMSVYHYEKDYPRYFELLVYMERPDFNTNAESYISISHLLQIFFTEHIQRQIDNGFIKKTVNPLISNYFCWGSCMGVMQFMDAKKAFLKDSEKIEQRELFESYVNVLIDGMRT